MGGASSTLARGARLTRGTPHSPGVVNTDMGKASAAMFGMKAEDFPDVIDQNESGKGVVAQLDEAARTKVSGRFVNWKGDVMPW